MGILRFVLWSAICVGLGVFAASVEVGGGTPLSHLTRLWKQQAPRLDEVKEQAGEVVNGMRKKVAGPTERHSAPERDAVNEIIAKRQR